MIHLAAVLGLLHTADSTEDCLNRNDFDHQPYGDSSSHAYPTGNDGHDSNYDADPRDQAFQHPCIDLRKVLSGGTFYYSVDFDVTNRLQGRYGFFPC